MRYRYLDDFRRGISVFAIFSYGIAVLGAPQCPPQWGGSLGCRLCDYRQCFLNHFPKYLGKYRSYANYLFFTGLCVSPLLTRGMEWRKLIFEPKNYLHYF